MEVKAKVHAPVVPDQLFLSKEALDPYDDIEQVDHRQLYDRLFRFQAYAECGKLVISAAQLTSDWINSTGLQQPTLITDDTRYAVALASILQPDLQDLDKLAGLVESSAQGGKFRRDDGKDQRKEDKEVQTLDVIRQCPGPKWTIGQWCLYWRDRQLEPPGTVVGQEGPGGHTKQRPVTSDVAAHMSRATSSEGKDDMEDEADSAFVHQGQVDQFQEHSAPRKGIRDALKKRLIAMTCMGLVDTPLAECLAPPAALKAADLLAHVGTGGLQEVLKHFAQQQHIAISPAGSVVNFHIDPSGATAWYNVVHGNMVVVAVPPTERNLELYASWVDRGARERGLFLLETCQGAIRIEVKGGQSVIVPGGWPYATVATADSFMLGVQFLHVHNLKLQLVAWELEELLHVKPRLRYPGFKHLMWNTALHYAKNLRVATGLPKLAKQRVTSSKEQLGQALTTSRNQGGLHAGREDSTTRAESRKRHSPDQHCESELMPPPSQPSKRLRLASSTGLGIFPSLMRPLVADEGDTFRPQGLAPPSREVSAAGDNSLQLHAAHTTDDDAVGGVDTTRRARRAAAPMSVLRSALARRREFYGDAGSDAEVQEHGSGADEPAKRREAVVESSSGDEDDDDHSEGAPGPAPRRVYGTPVSGGRRRRGGAAAAKGQRTPGSRGTRERPRRQPVAVRKFADFEYNSLESSGEDASGSKDSTPGGGAPAEETVASGRARRAAPVGSLLQQAIARRGLCYDGTAGNQRYRAKTAQAASRKAAEWSDDEGSSGSGARGMGSRPGSVGRGNTRGVSGSSGGSHPGSQLEHLQDNMGLDEARPGGRSRPQRQRKPNRFLAAEMESDEEDDIPDAGAVQGAGSDADVSMEDLGEDLEEEDEVGDEEHLEGQRHSGRKQLQQNAGARRRNVARAFTPAASPLAGSKGAGDSSHQARPKIKLVTKGPGGAGPGGAAGPPSAVRSPAAPPAAPGGKIGLKIKLKTSQATAGATAPEAVPAQPPPAAGKTKITLKLSSKPPVIPQVDGACDTEDEDDYDAYLDKQQQQQQQQNGTQIVQASTSPHQPAMLLPPSAPSPTSLPMPTPTHLPPSHHQQTPPPATAPTSHAPTATLNLSSSIHGGGAPVEGQGQGRKPPSLAIPPPPQAPHALHSSQGPASLSYGLASAPTSLASGLAHGAFSGSCLPIVSPAAAPAYAFGSPVSLATLGSGVLSPAFGSGPMSPVFRTSGSIFSDLQPAHAVADDANAAKAAQPAVAAPQAALVATSSQPANTPFTSLDAQASIQRAAGLPASTIVPPLLPAAQASAQGQATHSVPQQQQHEDPYTPASQATSQGQAHPATELKDSEPSMIQMVAGNEPCSTSSQPQQQGSPAVPERARPATTGATIGAVGAVPAGSSSLPAPGGEHPSGAGAAGSAALPTISFTGFSIPAHVPVSTTPELPPHPTALAVVAPLAGAVAAGAGQQEAAGVAGHAPAAHQLLELPPLEPLSLQLGHVGQTHVEAQHHHHHHHHHHRHQHQHQQGAIAHIPQPGVNQPQHLGDAASGDEQAAHQQHASTPKAAQHHDHHQEHHQQHHQQHDHNHHQLHNHEHQHQQHPHYQHHQHQHDANEDAAQQQLSGAAAAIALLSSPEHPSLGTPGSEPHLPHLTINTAHRKDQQLRQPKPRTPHFKTISEAAPTAAKVELVALGSNRNKAKAAPSLKSMTPRRLSGPLPFSVTIDPATGMPQPLAEAAPGADLDALATQQHAAAATGMQVEGQLGQAPLGASLHIHMHRQGSGGGGEPGSASHAGISGSAHGFTGSRSGMSDPMQLDEPAVASAAIGTVRAPAAGTAGGTATTPSWPVPTAALVAGGSGSGQLLLPAIQAALLAQGPSSLPGTPTASGCTPHAFTTTTGATSMSQHQHLLHHHGAGPLQERPSITLSAWEMGDLPVVVSTLRHWLGEGSYLDELPFTLKDPGFLLDQLEEAVRVAAPAAASATAPAQAVQAVADLTNLDSAPPSAVVHGTPEERALIPMPSPPPVLVPSSMAPRVVVAAKLGQVVAAPQPRAVRLASLESLPVAWRRPRPPAQSQEPSGLVMVDTYGQINTVEETAETGIADNDGFPVPPPKFPKVAAGRRGVAELRAGPGGRGLGAAGPRGVKPPANSKMAKMKKSLGL